MSTSTRARLVNLLRWIGIFAAAIGFCTVVVFLAALLVPPWRPHLLNLSGRSWKAMVKATGTNTLGFVVWTLAIAAIGWASTVDDRWLELRREGAEKPLREAFLASLWIGVFMAAGVGVLVLGAFALSLVHTVYAEHQAAVRDNATLRDRNEALSKELDWRKHNISTTDAVFPNIIHLLQAFNSYRHAQNGKPCVVMLSAQPDSNPMASMIASFSNSVSGCFTLGPMDASINPDVEKRALNGMIRDKIVFHAARNDKAADQLFLDLVNLIQLKRSYDLPSPTERTHIYSIPTPGQEDLIWLQFGMNVKWNSESR
jgi:hypothetical protein